MKYTIENKAANKTTTDIVKMIKEHVAEHKEYTALTLVSGIVSDKISGKPWEEPNHDIIKKYINADVVDELEKLGFKFDFYSYNEHKVEKNGIETTVTDTWALAITWYNWTPLSEIFRAFKLN